MSVEDPRPNAADDRPVEDDDIRSSPPDRLDAPLEADEADVLDQALEAPLPDPER